MSVESRKQDITLIVHLDGIFRELHSWYRSCSLDQKEAMFPLLQAIVEAHNVMEAHTYPGFPTSSCKTFYRQMIKQYGLEQCRKLLPLSNSLGAIDHALTKTKRKVE